MRLGAQWFGFWQSGFLIEVEYNQARAKVKANEKLA